MPVASQIGQIYANQINFRQSIKDKIEDYIIKTETAKFDPAVLRQQQAFLKTLQERVNGLEGDLAELADRKDKTVGDLIDRFTAAEGQKVVATLQGEAKVLASANTAVGQAAAARTRAKASVASANLGLQGKVIDAQAKANDQAWDRVVDEENEGDRGVFTLLGKAAEEGRSSPIGTADQLSAQLDRMAGLDWKAKLDSLASPLARQRWIENFISTAETYARSIPSTTRKNAIDAELEAAGLSVADLALQSLGIDPAEFKSKDQTALLQEELKKNGWKEIPNTPGYDVNSITAVGMDLRRGLPPAPIAAKPRLADALGLAADENGTIDDKENEFLNRASYNYYLVDSADKAQPTITYEEFIGNDAVSKPFSDKARSASFYELAKFGDKAYIDLILAKKGAESDLTKSQSAYKESFSTIPSYDQIARQTLETYSGLYGGKKQQRQVALADYGRENLFDVDVFVDQTTGKVVLPPKTQAENAAFQQRIDSGEVKREIKKMQLDVPELEALGFAGGLAGGGVTTKTVGEEKRTGMSAFSGKGADSVSQSFSQKLKPSETRAGVREQVVAEENLGPIEEPMAQTGFGGRIAPRVPSGPDFPTERRDLKPGEVSTFAQVAGGPPKKVQGGPDISGEITPEGPDLRKPLAKEELKLISSATDAMGLGRALESSLLLNPDNVSLLSQDEIAEAGKTVQALSTFLETTRDQDPQLAQEKMRALGTISRNLLAADKSNPLALEDFDTKTPDQIRSAVEGQKAKPPLLSARQQRDVVTTMTVAAAAKAAAVAEKQRQEGKKETPEKVIPNASSITPQQKEQIKKLAETPGRFSADGLSKAIKTILGDKASAKVIEAATAIYLAYEQLEKK